MKYIIVIGDGMADRPVKEAGGSTPLQVAQTPNMNRLAERGIVGLVRTIPEGMEPGSDVAILSILGYDPLICYTGRAPLEAAARGISLEREDVAYRVNLISTDGEKILDYAAGHISSPEARELIEYLDERLGDRFKKFIPGVSYRHLLIWRNGPVDVKCVPPHDIVGQPLEENLPQGEREHELTEMIWASFEILKDHEINLRRIDEGKPPANMIWPWGQGRRPRLTSLQIRERILGAIISAVDLVKGIGIYAGLKVIEVPGATGYKDTNFEGKAEYGLRALDKFDLVVIHVEAPDECGHEGDFEEKVKAIENLDKRLVGRVLEGLTNLGEGWRILIVSDHLTPVEVRRHTADPTPFVLAGEGVKPRGPDVFDEFAAADSGLLIDPGHRLLSLLLTEERSF